ncbi:MAG: hypothetical protein LUQ32_10085 [Methanomicrobiales archaeon]|nr:hypothetical protein [Methanomicrobiales archaeon]
MPRPAAVLLALPLLFSAVLGIGVVIQPDSIMEGNQISITLSNVTDGYTLNTTLVSTFPAVSSTSWFNVTNWRYPFTLKGGNVLVSGQNVNRITLLIRAGSSIQGAPPKPGTGDITVELPMDILTGVYYDYRVLYEVHNASAPVTITLIQQGSKAGPDVSVSTPYIYGADGGNLTIEVLANGTLEGSQVVRVGNPAPTPATTPQVTTVPRSPTPPTISTTPPATPSPPVETPSVPPTPPPTPGSVSFSPWIIGYAAIVIVITILADYFIMRD